MSRRPRPVFCLWDGEHFIPNSSFKHYCDREFTIGEFYPLIVEEERSMASHGHYFAALGEAFNNLPEESAKHFPNKDAFRAWCLVQCGYYVETNYVLADEKQARKLAADIRVLSPYTVIKVRGNVVQRFDPESQSKAAMKKERFEQSKHDVLALAASMSRTTPSQLNKEARHHGR